MKKILLWAMICLTMHLSAEVTISNAPTSGMVFLAGTWEPTAPVANLNISELLVTLSGGDVLVVDFTPSTCLGPLIVQEPIIYNLGNSLTLSSCLNLMIYNLIENQGNGSINLSSTGSVPGTGYLVVGTGVGAIPTLTNGTYGMPAAPLPANSTPVHVGSLGGPTFLSAPFLIAVVGDSSTGQYAQVGLPLDLATGGIAVFSGQSIAIGSGIASGCHARIGHGASSIISPIGGQIDLVNENGNMFLESYSSAPGTYAAVGHQTASGPISGNINVMIEGTPGFGNIWINGGDSEHARIGHHTLLNAAQPVAGAITVQCRGNLLMQGGSCLQCGSEIGHRSQSTGITSGPIVVESGAGANLSGGTGEAPARVGHTAPFVALTPLDAPVTVAVVGDLSVLAGADGPATIGHHATAPGPGQALGDISLFVHSDLTITGGAGASSRAGVGHTQETGVAAFGGGEIICYTAGGLGLTSGLATTAESFIAHRTQLFTGTLTATSAGGIISEAILAESVIEAEGVVQLSSGDSITLRGTGGTARLQSLTQGVLLQAMRAVTQDSPLPGMSLIDPATALTIDAGDDITLAETIFPQGGTVLQVVQLDADHSFLGGELWLPPGYFSFFIPDLFLLTALESASPVAPDDAGGAFISSTAFQPMCNDLIILSSCQYAGTGLGSTLEIGAGLALDPSFVSGFIQIGDTIVASDSSQAKRQSYQDVLVHDVSFAVDSIFIKACRDIHVWNTVLNTNGPLVCVADNKFPVAPAFGPGVFTSDNVQMTSGASDGIQLYSASQTQNMAAGGLTNTMLNSVLYSACSTSCTYEIWSTYFNAGSVSPGAHRLYYKDSPVLAVPGLSLGVDCQNGDAVITWELNGEDKTGRIALQAWDGLEWQTVTLTEIQLGDGPAQGDWSIADLDGRFVRVAAFLQDGPVQYSSIEEISCANQFDVHISPNPAIDHLKVICSGPGVFRLVDPVGHVVISRLLTPGETMIEIQNNPSGLYFCTWTRAEGVDLVQPIYISEN